MNSIAGLQGRMSVEPKYLPSGKDLITSLGHITELITKVNDKYSVVQIVASDSTLGLAKDWLTRCVEGMSILGTAVTVKEGLYYVDQAKNKPAADKMVDAANVETKFLDSARKDVNAYG